MLPDGFYLTLEIDNALLRDTFLVYPALVRSQCLPCGSEVRTENSSGNSSSTSIYSGQLNLNLDSGVLDRTADSLFESDRSFQSGLLLQWTQS
jgi:hypothetical protein